MVKNKNVNLNNASGFSLVELMVVVAIIGILASVAVPQFQKFTFKARMTEAKAGLSSLFTAEKAFYAEWSQYDSRFRVIGYNPEGTYYFNIGFSANGATEQSGNWNLVNTAALPDSDQNTLARCLTTSGAAAACRSTNTAAALPAAAPIVAGACNPANGATPTFTACASAGTGINPDNVAPQLAITQSKTLVQNTP